jgi:IMP cyclohydrolase
VATYEVNSVRDEQNSEFDAADAGAAAAFAVSGGQFAEQTDPVTAAAALARGPRFEIACHSVGVES